MAKGKPSEPKLLVGHQGAVYDGVWHAGTGRWVTAGGDGVVAAWDPASPGTGEAWLHHGQPFFSLGTDGDWMHAGTDQGEWWAWRPAEAREPRRLLAHSRGIFALTPWAPGVLFTGGGDGRFAQWQWDEAGWVLLRDIPLPSGGKVRCLSPGPESLLIGTAESGWGEWHVATARWLHWEGAGGAYCAHWLAHKGAWLLGGRDGHLRVWHAHTPQETGLREIWSFPAHQGTVYRLVATPQALWTASRDKTLKAWHPETLAPLARIERIATGHTRSVNALAARPLPGGDWELLSGGDDRRGQLHRVSDWL